MAKEVMARGWSFTNPDGSMALPNNLILISLVAGMLEFEILCEEVVLENI